MKIGFTVGCWDLFHEGHMNHLRIAKGKCDFLHVGIMTDYWVRVQKGHDRPAESLEMRICNLRGKLGDLLDNVVVLDTLDVMPYLQMSHIWFRGPNQRNMRPIDYPGIVIIPETMGVSTTLLLAQRAGAPGEPVSPITNSGDALRERASQLRELR